MHVVSQTETVLAGWKENLTKQEKKKKKLSLMQQTIYGCCIHWPIQGVYRLSSLSDHAPCGMD